MPFEKTRQPTIPFQEKGLYFLHIPKTAGTSVRYWLHDLFPSDGWLPCHTLEEVERMDPAIVRQARFLSGHLGLKIFDWINADKPVITWLRNPIKRLISNYTFNRSCFDELVQIAVANGRPEWVEYYEAAQKLSIVELIQSEFHLGFNDNLQTRYLAGIFPQTDQAIMIDNSILSAAKKRLSQLDFVGICEWMSASIDLLSFRLGTPYRPLTLQFNSSGSEGKTSSLQLTATDYESIKTAERFDLQLYEFAKTLFIQRFAKYWEEFSQTNSFFKLGIPDYPELTRQQQRWLEEYDRIAPKSTVKQFINGRFQRTATKQGQQTDGFIDFKGQVFGAGWHPRFQFKNRFLRWSGPTNRSTIFLPLLSSRDYRVEFVMRVVADFRFVQSLRIAVSGTTVKHEFQVQPPEPDQPRAVDISFEVPKHLVETNGTWTEIEFTVDGPLVVAASVPPSLVSFATDGFRFFAKTQEQVHDCGAAQPHFAMQPAWNSALADIGS